VSRQRKARLGKSHAQPTFDRKEDSVYGTFGATFLGPMSVMATEKGICGIHFDDDVHCLRRRSEAHFPALQWKQDAWINDWLTKVCDLIDRGIAPRELPLDLHGTDFQLSVWQELRRVRCGTTITYSELACRVGRPRAVRATASACGANPVAVVIPCHRIVRTDGGLGGYRWGLQRKRKLLESEGNG